MIFTNLDTNLTIIIFPSLFIEFAVLKIITFLASSWCGIEKYLCFLFITSRTLLQRKAEFNSLLWRKFFTCYSCGKCKQFSICSYLLKALVSDIFRGYRRKPVAWYRWIHYFLVLSFICPEKIRKTTVFSCFQGV